MSRDRSNRRDRRQNPNVICLPSQLPPYTPPRRESEANGSMAVPDEATLDTELLAHKNIFDSEPRMSRQARRKALRAEKKAARRTATERFLIGAPSLGEAAMQAMACAAEPEAEIAREALVEPEHDDLAKAEPLDADVVLLERPEVEEHEPASFEAEMVETVEAAPLVEAEPEPASLNLEDIAQMISATGPLVTNIAAMEQPPMRVSPDAWGGPGVDATDEIVAEMEQPVPGETASFDLEPAAPKAVPIEAMTTPLPRDRALVPQKRSWLMRLIPWRRRVSRQIAPEPAMAQLQELRFELATALRRLDQILEGAV